MAGQERRPPHLLSDEPVVCDEHWTKLSKELATLLGALDDFWGWLSTNPVTDYLGMLEHARPWVEAALPGSELAVFEDAVGFKHMGGDLVCDVVGGEPDEPVLLSDIDPSLTDVSPAVFLTLTWVLEVCASLTPHKSIRIACCADCRRFAMKFKDSLSLSEEALSGGEVVVLRGSIAHPTEAGVRNRCVDLLLTSSKVVANAPILDKLDMVTAEMERVYREYSAVRLEVDECRSVSAERDILSSELDECQRELSSEKVLRAKADRAVVELQRRPKPVERPSPVDKGRIADLERRLATADRELRESRRESSALRERADSLEASASLMEKQLVAELETSSGLQFKLSQNSPQSVFAYSLFGPGLDIPISRTPVQT